MVFTGNKRSSVASLRRVICEAVNDAAAESQLEAGFAKALAPAIEAATDQLMDAIGMAAERFEKHPQFGRYVDASSMRSGSGGMWHDIRPKLHDGITKIVNDACDEFIENEMSNEEDAFSNGDTYSSGGYDRVVRDRDAYRSARGKDRY